MARIALIVGSLSQQSINRSIANHMFRSAPQGMETEEIRIEDLPLYVAGWRAFATPDGYLVEFCSGQQKGVGTSRSGLE